MRQSNLLAAKRPIPTSWVTSLASVYFYMRKTTEKWLIQKRIFQHIPGVPCPYRRNSIHLGSLGMRGAVCSKKRMLGHIFGPTNSAYRTYVGILGLPKWFPRKKRVEMTQPLSLKCSLPKKNSDPRLLNCINKLFSESDIIFKCFAVHFPEPDLVLLSDIVCLMFTNVYHVYRHNLGKWFNYSNVFGA